MSIMLTTQIARRATDWIDALLFVTTNSADAAETMPRMAEILRAGHVTLSGDVVNLHAGDRLHRCRAEVNFLDAARKHGQVVVMVGFRPRPEGLDANLYFDQVSNEVEAYTYFWLEVQS